MANYNSLKAAIVDVIKTNGNKEITGQLLQNSLVAMINSLGAGYQFAGVAIPATNPGTPDYNVFYFAGPGTYPNFNNATIPARNVGLLSYNGTWHVSSVQTTPFSAESIVNDIIQLYDGSTPVYPRTRAEAVFFDNDTTKTLDQQFSQLGQEVNDTIDYQYIDKELLDFDNAQADTRATGSYGADITSTYASSGWTAFPPIYFSETGVAHTIKTNVGTGAQLLGYKKSGENYVREVSVNLNNITPDEHGVKSYDLGTNIAAIRFEAVTTSVVEGLFLHSTGEIENIVTIKESVNIPKLTQEVARLDERIDEIVPDMPWNEKKICGIGDSIMIGCYESTEGGHTKGDAILDGEAGSSYGYEINSTGGFLGALRAKYQNVDILNMGVGSTTMARNNNITTNANYLCITDRIDNIPQTGYDYILLMGGCNDFFHKDTYSVPYGTESNVEYLPLLADYDVDEEQYAANSFRLYPFSGAGNQDLDITTFCGAMEIAIIKLMVRFKSTKLGYIIPHAIRPTTEMNTYLDYAKNLCKKYGIPCLDLRELAMMPRILSIAGNNSGSLFTLDAVHPNTLGYEEKYLPAFEAWLRTL